MLSILLHVEISQKYHNDTVTTAYSEKNLSKSPSQGFGSLRVTTFSDLVGKNDNVDLQYNIETSHLFPSSKGDCHDLACVPTRFCSQNASFARHKNIRFDS